METKTLLTEGQAAVVLAVSKRTLQGWRTKGEGPHFLRLGRGRGAVRYDQAALKAYIASRVRASTSDLGEAASD